MFCDYIALYHISCNIEIFLYATRTQTVREHFARGQAIKLCLPTRQSSARVAPLTRDSWLKIVITLSVICLHFTFYIHEVLNIVSRSPSACPPSKSHSKLQIAFNPLYRWRSPTNEPETLAQRAARMNVDLNFARCDR